MKFNTGTKPKPQRHFIPEWKHFKPGDIVEMKGAFFQIHRINPLARQMILIGIKDPRVNHEPKK